ncbi:aerobactin synthase [Kushneria avicenniae]|uniref:Aerobactin synthase n=1 Tax=Kushneria avicenniae TaxID=402385 RepID=A0A1I1LWY7_9GAMM|nr:IucA/IucC family protein [Kushneria avicenniae]SFC75458.1 aerobactin synthase [Kushneria avicenniae]
MLPESSSSILPPRLAAIDPDEAIRRHWARANRALIAKMISELAYEQVLLPEACGATDDEGWRLDIEPVAGKDRSTSADSRACGRWHFRADTNLWGQLLIEAESLAGPGSAGEMPEAAEFLLALAPGMGMKDSQLAEHLEDLFNTLRGDCYLIEVHQRLGADDAIRLAEPQRQAVLDGHPKFLFNKGRRGWGVQSLGRYAPEYGHTFQVEWLMVRRECLKSSRRVIDEAALLDSVLDHDQRRALLAARDGKCAVLGEKAEAYALMPVHPWQWARMLSMLHIGDIGRGDMAWLGAFGDDFVAQQSLRTLTNASRPGQYDLKLPITIMNTSSYRGIPGQYMLAGPAASQWLQARANDDEEFRRAGLEILAEPASAVFEHTQYGRLDEAPYRFRELCGVIWREGLAPRVGEGEQALLMSELMQCDADGRAWLAAYIEASGIEAEQWLYRMFEVTLIPMYHLICRFGVIIIAHGQNLTLILRDGVPHRLALKDFQGDLRLVDEDFPEARDLPSELVDVTVRLPPEKLIHDLQTGHFVTLLRFVAPLAVQAGVSETRFYQLCAKALGDYMARQQGLAARFDLFSLFKPRILRLGLNRSKFLHANDHSAARMLPDMDHHIDNPLYHCLSDNDPLRHHGEAALSRQGA